MFFSNSVEETMEKEYITEIPSMEINTPKPMITKETEQVVMNTPKPTITKKIESVITNIAKPTITKVIEQVITSTPKPMVTKETEQVIINTPKPTITKVEEQVITNTPTPTTIIIKNDQPDLLESLNGKRILFSTEDAQTFHINVRDYKAYLTGNVGNYYVEYGCIDNEMLVVSLEEKITYISTKFPHLEDNSSYNFNTIGYYLTIKPLKEGMTQVYFRLYQDKDCTKLYGEVYFTVEVEFMEEEDFPIGAYNPIACGYPYKEHEWKYGNDIIVSVWADKDRKRAVLVVEGSGRMWNLDEAIENNQIETPWCYSAYCNYVQKIYEVHIGEGITHVVGFDSVAKLEVVTFPSTLKSIGKFAFKNAKFKELILPEGLEYIEERAFLWCSKLEYIKLPSTLKYIGENAFGLEAGSEERSKNILKEIEIPNSVEFIGCYAFGYRYNTNIILSDELDTSKFDKEWNVIPW